MMFAIIDYANFCLGAKNYGENYLENVASIGFRNKIPDHIIQQMKSGDAILVQNLASIFSWGTMYFESSKFNHVAVYIGQRKILHQTLSYSKVHHLDVLFGKKVRLLVVSMPVGKVENNEEPKITPKKQGENRLILKNKLSLIFISMPRILMNFNHDAFRSKFIVDGMTVVFLISLVIYFLSGSSTSFVALPMYLAIVSFNSARWFLRRKNYSPKGGLGSALQSLLAAGGKVIISEDSSILTRGHG